MNVYGLQHVEAVSHERPILMVANHRSFFDMYAVSTVLFRSTKWRKQLFFSSARSVLLPVTARAVR
ncbi:MAG: 1-acyl-sn-glycerol-3-phosphate acyltransferase [Pyrinomonadaceae bacterium]